MNWEEYKKWARLYQISELVSLDCTLCPLAFEVDYEKEETYTVAVTDEEYATYLFNNLAYVLSKVPFDHEFNLLAVVKSPEQECKDFEIEGFDFVVMNF